MGIQYDPSGYEMPWRRNYELMAAGVWLTGAAGYAGYAAFGSFPPGPLLWIAGGMTVFGAFKLRKGLRLLNLQQHLAGTPLPLCTFEELREICNDPVHKGEIWLGKGFLWGPTHTQRIMDILRLDWQRIVKDALGPFYAWRFAKKNASLVFTHPLKARHLFLEQQKSLNDKGQPWIHGVGGGEDNIFQPISHAEGHTLVIGTTGSGKAQPLTAKILTPTGWQTMADMAPDKYVVNWRGEPVRVEAVYDRGSLIPYELRTEDGRSTKACGEHLWTVWIRRSERTRDSRAKDFLDAADPLVIKESLHEHMMDNDYSLDFAPDLTGRKPATITTKMIEALLEEGWIVELPAYSPARMDWEKVQKNFIEGFGRRAVLRDKTLLELLQRDSDKFWKDVEGSVSPSLAEIAAQWLVCGTENEDADPKDRGEGRPLRIPYQLRPLLQLFLHRIGGFDRLGLEKGLGRVSEVLRLDLEEIGDAFDFESLKTLNQESRRSVVAAILRRAGAVRSERDAEDEGQDGTELESSADGSETPAYVTVRVRKGSAEALVELMRSVGVSAQTEVREEGAEPLLKILPVSGSDPVLVPMGFYMRRASEAYGAQKGSADKPLARLDGVNRIRVKNVERAGEAVPMRCIRLSDSDPDALYVTDDWIVTHNTRCFDLLISQAILRGECVIIIDPKGDNDLKQKAQRACEALGRKNAFVMFHPAKTEESAHINLLANWTRPTELASRIANLIQSTGQSDPFKNFSWDALNKVAQGLCIAYEKPSIMNLRRYLESSPEELFEKAFSKHILKSYGDSGEKIIAKLYSACKRDTIENRVTALVNYYLQHGPADPALDGLISLRNHDKEHFGKMVTSLLPILSQLTSGKLGRLLSPPEDPDEQGTAIFRDTGDFIEKNAVVYMGLDSLSDNMVGSAIGSLMLADLTAAAGSIYNFKEERRIVNVFVDEAAECVNDSFIQLLNKGRGAKFKLVVATQTISDFAARLGSMDKAMQVVGNLNNTISLRCIDEKTQQFVTRRFPKTKVKSVAIDQGLSTDADHALPKGGRLGERLTEEEVDLFPSQLLGMLPDLEFIANLSGGKVVKGRYPFLLQDRSEFRAK